MGDAPDHNVAIRAVGHETVSLSYLRVSGRWRRNSHSRGRHHHAFHGSSSSRDDNPVVSLP